MTRDALKAGDRWGRILLPWIHWQPVGSSSWAWPQPSASWQQAWLEEVGFTWIHSLGTQRDMAQKVGLRLHTLSQLFIDSLGIKPDPIWRGETVPECILPLILGSPVICPTWGLSLGSSSQIARELYSGLSLSGTPGLWANMAQNSRWSRVIVSTIGCQAGCPMLDQGPMLHQILLQLYSIKAVAYFSPAR